MASYPSAIKTFVQLEDGVDTCFALYPNERGDEITAIETALGLTPQGPDTDVLTRLNRHPIIKLTNKQGASVAAGDVLVLDTSNDSAFVKTTTQGLRRPVYVARATIANNALGYVQCAGVIAVAVTGAVTRGNFLRTSTTSGQAEDAGSVLASGVFAKALESYAGPGAGTVLALLFGSTFDSGITAGEEIVSETDIAAATSGSISSLVGDTYEWLKVVFQGTWDPAATTDTLAILPNGSSTNTVGYTQKWGDENDATPVAHSAKGFVVGVPRTAGHEIMDILIEGYMATRKNVTGQAGRTFIGRAAIDIPTATVRFGLHCHGVLRSITSEITSVMLQATAGNINGRLTVLRRKGP